MKVAGRAAWTMLACAASASAFDRGEESTRALAAGCLACHQPVQGALPRLDGQPRELLASKFRSFRDGTQPGTVMPQLAKGYSDAQIDAIAGYFATRSEPR
jgi:cytochrome subunit of sulfide dehydrogenase